MWLTAVNDQRRVAPPTPIHADTVSIASCYGGWFGLRRAVTQLGIDIPVVYIVYTLRK